MLTPALDARFQEPQGWRWGSFKNSQGLKIRFGTVTPENGIPSATVVILPGRGEFAEKYFETAHDLLKQDFSVWIMDWQGQGGSERPLPATPQRGVSPPFEYHVQDLHQFILEQVNATNADRIPMIMIAQSMGAHLGLRYLHKHPGIFKSAALSAPMLGLQATKSIPSCVALLLTKILSLFAKNSYAFGQHDWQPNAGELVSHDPYRSKIQKMWFESAPELRVGGVTNGWLYHALSSCKMMRRPDILRSIQTPCLIVKAGQETLIDNRAIDHAATLLPHVTFLNLSESGHEPLMETDTVRDAFFTAFRKLALETLKSF